MTKIRKQKEGMKQQESRRWRMDPAGGSAVSEVSLTTFFPTRQKRAARFFAFIPLCIGLFLLALSLKAGAEEQIPVTFSRTATVPAETDLQDEALLLDGVTYVPFRAFCTQADDCDITWDASTRTATATLPGGVSLRARVGDLYLQYGDRYFYTVAPIRIVKDRLYLPVRPLARCFGYEVTWSTAARSVWLKAGARPASSGVYDEEELYWLSRLIEAESGAEPFRGKIAVGNVVQNRVASPQFPDTVYGVIFDTKYGVQFTPTANGMIYRAPSSDSVAAAAICLEGYSLSDEILYFYDPDLSGSTWFRRHCTYAFRIGGHEFYTP